MGAAEWDEDVRRRVHALTEAITYSVFLHTSQGLFETDKLTFLSHTAFQVRNSPSPPHPTPPQPSPRPPSSCHPHQSKHFSAPTLAPIKSSQQDLALLLIASPAARPPCATAHTVGSDREAGSDGIMQLSVIVPTVFIPL